MNICMLVGTDMAHDARVGKEARTLVDAGHQVTVLAAYNSALPAEETQNGVRIIRVAPSDWRRRPSSSTVGRALRPAGAAPAQACDPAKNVLQTFRSAVLWALRGSWWQARLARETLRLMRQVRPDVIHIHDADRLLIGFIGHLVLRVPFIYDAHEFVAGLLVDDTRGARSTRRWHLALERLIAPRALAVITVNDVIAERLRRRHRLWSVTVVHNFPLLSAAPSDRSLLRERLPEPLRSRHVLIYQGRLTAGRGIELFVETVARIPAVAGVIVGSGPLRPALRALAVRLGVADRLVFVPEVPWRELAAYTAGADLGFCLSQPTCENNVLALPNKLFEYLMAGVPVIASDYPVLRRYVAGEDAGLLVSPDNVEQISTAVAALLGDPERLALMRGNARRAAARYNWTGEERVLRTLYSQFVEAPVPGRSAPWQSHAEDISRR